jgi:hypothetical protein
LPENLTHFGGKRFVVRHGSTQMQPPLSEPHSFAYSSAPM